jgi:hypothetical protein
MASPSLRDLTGEGPQYDPPDLRRINLLELQGRREGVSLVGGRCHDSTFFFLARISRMTRIWVLCCCDEIQAPECHREQSFGGVYTLPIGYRLLFS